MTAAPYLLQPSGGSAPVQGDAPERGLVICAITGRSSVPETPEGVWKGHRSRFPSPDLVAAAAALIPRVLPNWDGSEGPRSWLEIGPGLVRLGRTDLAREHRTLERAREDRPADRDWLRMVDELPMVWDERSPRTATPRGAIREFSKRSQARMFAMAASLDWSGFQPSADALPAMVTLTYPGDWLTVVPDAATDARHVKALLKRYARDWGHELAGMWKRETQHRGAPHRHIFCMVPMGLSKRGEGFLPWLSRTWADVVGHPDPLERAKHELAGTGVDFADGLRSTDPLRVAAYFLKHSAGGVGKEYQNRPVAEWTESAGRFWGVWRLKTATVRTEVPHDDRIRLARYCRRWARAQGTTREVRVPRIDAAGTVHTRRVRRRVRRLGSSAGFVVVNDGPAFVSQLLRALELHDTPREPTEYRPF